MARNVEIKARISNPDVILKIAEELSGNPAELIRQEDVFFPVDNGRFKLRILSPSSGQLVFYERDDTRGPKTSTYQVVETDHPDDMRGLLASAYGEKIVVRKLRHFYLVGRTRIHIDSVEGLGDFLELEVKLKDHEAPEAGIKEADELMSKLGIGPDDLLVGAYADLLEQALLPV